MLEVYTSTRYRYNSENLSQFYKRLRLLKDLQFRRIDTEVDDII